jgi:hypothetical protein
VHDIIVNNVGVPKLTFKWSNDHVDIQQQICVKVVTTKPLKTWIRVHEFENKAFYHDSQMKSFYMIATNSGEWSQ